MKDTIKRLKAVTLALLILMLCGCGGKGYTFDIDTSHDFRNCDLGYSLEEVKEAETIALPKETKMSSYTILTYDNVKVDGIDAKIMYTIDGNNKLDNCIVYYKGDDVEGIYDDLASKCYELYGDHYVKDSVSIYWRVDGHYVSILKTNSKVAYSICSEESFDNGGFVQ